MTSRWAVAERETRKLMTQFGEKWFSRKQKHDPSGEIARQALIGTKACPGRTRAVSDREFRIVSGHAPNQSGLSSDILKVQRTLPGLLAICAMRATLGLYGLH